jgi:ferredoxin
MMKDDSGRTGVYHTTFLASENNDFAALNANIHVCNECGHELIDVRDPNNIHKLHINMDAYDKEFSREDKKVHAVGCEDCLIQCPDCGGWHFDYAKFVGSRIYEKVELAPGREFIRGLRTIDANYCACREGIEWIYDERSGTDNEHDIIPAIKMAFVNYANEMIASYEEYKAYYVRKHPARALSATDEQKFAKKTRTEFKKQLASRFDIDTRDISITSIDKCSKCTVCGGEYYRGVVWGDADDDYRCNVCDEMVTEKRRSVTRIDGIVFMRRTVKKKTVISKYIVTKLGNLKEISSAEVDLTPTVTEEEEPFDEVTVEAPNKDEVGKEEKK